MNDKSDNLLFHYTSIDSAISILDSGVLYFNHHKKVNDPTELFHADPLLYESAAKQALNEIIRVDKKLHFFSKGKGYRVTIDHDSRWLIKATSDTLGDDYYIFSSTYYTDKYDIDNGSLVMWRGYGSSNSCAMVFDKSRLISQIEKFSNDYSAAFIHGKIHYLENASEIQYSFTSEYKQFVNYLKYIASISLNPEKIPLYPELDGLSPFITMKALIKHHAFKSEMEYRMSIFRSLALKEVIEQVRIPVEDKKIKVPISERMFPIKKIIISPMSNQIENFEKINKFLKSKPEFLGISVTKSNIPFQS